MTEWEDKAFMAFLAEDDYLGKHRDRSCWYREVQKDDFYNGFSRAGLQYWWEQAML